MEVAKGTDKGMTRVQSGRSTGPLGCQCGWSGWEGKSKKIQKAWTTDRDREVPTVSVPDARRAGGEEEAAAWKGVEKVFTR